jgi:hypothetical protein
MEDSASEISGMILPQQVLLRVCTLRDYRESTLIPLHCTYRSVFALALAPCANST